MGNEIEKRDQNREDTANSKNKKGKPSNNLTIRRTRVDKGLREPRNLS